MKTRIALLRGINVGGNNIVPMKELKDLMEANGYRNVRTYIQSGNVVYDEANGTSTTTNLPDIGSLIQRRYGFKPTVFVLSVEAFQAAAANNPYARGEGNRVHFFFCDRIPESVDFDLLESLRAASEEYALVDDVFYLHAPDGIGRSKLAAKIDRAFPGVTITGRNLNTVNKLLGMIG